MKNPFKFFKSSSAKKANTKEPAAPVIQAEEPPEEPAAEEPAQAVFEDAFTEWCRSQIHGGIERRERNDIFEAYSVYGADKENRLTCRYYHRYPEHEKDFDLSSERILSFTDFNKRLLSELDRGDLKLPAYNACIAKAEQLSDNGSSAQAVYEGFSSDETAGLRDFCEGLDTLTDKEYRGGDGIFRCVCRSVVGDEALSLWFRKPLPHDALLGDVAGVSRTEIAGYDIENIWIMGVYNRLSERCESCQVTLLTSQWSLEKETVYLLTAKGFPAVDGILLLAVSDVAVFPRFGFYSLDFSNK